MIVLGRSKYARMIDKSKQHRIYEMHTIFSRVRKEVELLHRIQANFNEEIYTQLMSTFHTTSTDISVRYVRLLIHSPGKKKIEVKIENRN